MSSRWSDDISSLRRVAFDTNALIYGLERREPYYNYVNQALEMLQAGEALGFLSTLVEMELLVKPLRDSNLNAVNQMEIFLRGTPNLVIRSVDRVIARQAANIRARTGLRSVDAVIAATAIEERCDAIIGNDGMFASRVVGIPYFYLDDYLT